MIFGAGFFVFAAACGDDGGSGTGAGTGTSTSDGTSTSGASASTSDSGPVADSESGGDTAGPVDPFTPDDEECPAGGVDECTVDSDCCVGVQAASAFNDDKHACPSTTYPNDWSCDFDATLQHNVCVNAGCSDDADCGQMAIGGFAAMICREVDGVGHCLRFCTDDTGCDPDNLYMRCTGLADDGMTEFCQQDPQP